MLFEMHLFLFYFLFFACALWELGQQLTLCWMDAIPALPAHLGELIPASLGAEHGVLSP